MALEINGERIEDELIAEEFHHIKSHYTQRLSEKGEATTLPDDPTLLMLVKENITRKTLLRQEVIKHNILIPAEQIDLALAAFLERKAERTGNTRGGAAANILSPPNSHSSFDHSSSPPQAPATTPLAPFETSEASAEEQTKIRAHLEMNLKIEQLLTQVSADINEITPRHVKVFYETNRDHYLKGERRHLYYLACPSSVRARTHQSSPDHREMPPKTPHEASAHAHASLKAKASSDPASPTFRQLMTLKEAIEALPSTLEKQFVFTAYFPQPKSADPKVTQPARTDSALDQAKKLLHTHIKGVHIHTGDLGIREDRELAPQILTAVTKLEAAQLSSPILLDHYLYLFYVKERYGKGIPPLAEIADEVKRDLLREVQERKQDIYVAKLIEKSNVIDYEYL